MFVTATAASRWGWAPGQCRALCRSGVRPAGAEKRSGSPPPRGPRGAPAVPLAWKRSVWGGRCRQTPPHPESEDVCRRPCAGTRGRDVPERREPQKGDPSDPWLTPEVCRACGCEGPGQRTTAGSRFQRLHCRVTVLNLRREVRGLVNISGFSLRPWKGHI